MLVHSLQDVLDFQVYDYNDHRKDTLMSSASFPFSKLIDDQTHENLTSPLLKEGKTRGELRYDINFFPCIEPEEGKEEILDSCTSVQAPAMDHSDQKTILRSCWNCSSHYSPS